MNLHQAIIQLNSNIVTIRGDVAHDKDDNIVEYDMAAAQAKLAELQAAEAAAQQAAEEHKASALSKLAALGLTENEIKALLG